MSRLMLGCVFDLSKSWTAMANRIMSKEDPTFSTCSISSRKLIKSPVMLCTALTMVKRAPSYYIASSLLPASETHSPTTLQDSYVSGDVHTSPPYRRLRRHTRDYDSLSPLLRQAVAEH